MAALRSASASALPERCGATETSGIERPDTATMLMAHLSGSCASQQLAMLCRRAQAATYEAISVEAPQESLTRVNAEVEGILVPSAPFVRDLLARGWTAPEIAAEIVTLTFAGWASLEAVCRTARTVGVGGPNVTSAEVIELLRIAPPGWLITRETIEALALAGRADTVAPGTLLLMSPWLLHRDPTIWERPTEFDVTRLETETHPAYLPFGVGIRSCPAGLYSKSFLVKLLAQQTVEGLGAQTTPSLADARSACLTPTKEGHRA